MHLPRFLPVIVAGLLAAASCLLPTPASLRAAPPTPNLLRNGDFANATPDAWPGVAPANRPAAGAEAQLRREEGNGGRAFLSLTNADATGGASTTQTIRLDPNVHWLDFSGKIRVSKIEPGKESWQTARIQLTWKDDAGKDLTPWPPSPAHRKPTEGWQPFALRLQVPPGATQLAVAPAIFNAVGQADFADLRLVSLGGKDALIDAPAPTDGRVRWGEEPVENLGANRARICLNGLWKFLPATHEHVDEPKGGWGWMPVPGAWSFAKLRFFGIPGVAVEGMGKCWEGLGKDHRSDGWNAVTRAWYQRTVKVPEAWRNRAVFLDLTRVSTDAQVFVNGQDCGRVSWPGGRVDISKAVQPGAEAEVRLLVVGSLDKAVEIVFMGTAAEQIETRKAEIESRGLVDDVFLACGPAVGAAQVSDVFIQPSTRKKELALDLSVLNVKTAGPARVVVRCLDEKGNAEKTFEGTAAFAAKDAEQTVRLAFPWANPRLWDLEQPNLYTLNVRVEGRGWSDEYQQEFGFREFWQEGKRFVLNGTEIRLRPGVLQNQNDKWAHTIETMDSAMDGMRAIGFNCQEFWPWNNASRGTVWYAPLYLERANRKAWPVFAALPSMTGLIANWQDPKVRGDWEASTAAVMRRFRNHPSVIGWVHSSNRFGGWQDQNPRVMGNTAAITAHEEPNIKKIVPAGQDACNFIRQMDPTRPVSTHAGGNVGDFQMVNNYLNFIPIQEKEEWLSDWVKNGNVPVMPVEFGPLTGCDFKRGRNTGGWGGGKGATASENLQTEHMATFFGREAYAQESKKTKELHPKIFLQNQQYKDYNGYERDPLTQTMLADEVRALYRSWRTMGTTAGMIPWDYDQWWNKEHAQVPAPPFRPGQRGIYQPTVRKHLLHFHQPGGTKILPQGEALVENNSPTLAWIVGGDLPGDVAAFTAKDHSFRAGETVKKRVALLNDTRREQPYKITWTATAGGTEVGRGEKTGRIGLARTEFLPCEFALPTGVADKTDGEIKLTATIGDAKHEDEFKFRAFPAEEKPKSAGVPVLVFDPEGKTGALLAKLNFKAEPWNGQPDAGKLLVIGCEALSKGGKLPGDLRAFVEGGGRALVMTQHPDWLRKQLGLRVGYLHQRRMFFVDPKHPVAAGLDGADLANWTGHSKLVEARPIIDDKQKSSMGYPVHGWKWGNRGVVSSAAIEKPHTAGWRPLVEGDFDLAFSPLMELDFGKGRVTLCTLDLEDHFAVDPAAARLAANVVEHARTAPLTPRAKTLYLGADAGVDRLGAMGVAFERVEKVPTSSPGELLVLDPAAPGVDDAALRAFVSSGGKVLVLPARGETGPLGLKLTTKADFVGSLDVPTWEVCRGLSASDLRSRSPAPTVLAAGGEGIEVGADGLLARLVIGQGEVIFCQADPDRFEADTKTYFRLSRWRQTRAVTQTLANLGAAFTSDPLFFTPGWPASRRMGLDGEWKAKFTGPLPESKTELPDPGLTEAGRAAMAADFDDAGWTARPVPRQWDTYGSEYAGVDGEAVFRRTFEAPAPWVGQDLALNLGTIDDYDEVFFNGEPIGKTNRPERPYEVTRNYVVPGRLVRPGRNVIAVRVFDRFGDGGLTSSPGVMNLQPANAGKGAAGLYHRDHRTDFALGDDPHRYYRW